MEPGSMVHPDRTTHQALDPKQESNVEKDLLFGVESERPEYDEHLTTTWMDSFSEIYTTSFGPDVPNCPIECFCFSTLGYGMNNETGNQSSFSNVDPFHDDWPYW
jgi:hypothetical protein